MGYNGNLPAASQIVIEFLRRAEFVHTADGNSALQLAEQLEAAVTAADRCFMRATPDEPTFVLRAQDRHAQAAIRRWLSLAEGGLTHARMLEVDNCLNAFMEFAHDHPERMKYPD